MMYFPTKRGAKEPQNLQNHRVVGKGEKKLGFWELSSGLYSPDLQLDLCKWPACAGWKIFQG